MLLQGGNTCVQQRVLSSIRDGDVDSGAPASVVSGKSPQEITSSAVLPASDSSLTASTSVSNLLHDLHFSLLNAVAENQRRPWWLDVRESALIIFLCLFLYFFFSTFGDLSSHCESINADSLGPLCM